MDLLPRPAHVRRVLALLRTNPVVAILGARQVGKTTLARQVFAARSGPVHVFDLEDTRDLAALADPRQALGRLKGLVVLDEIHRLPEVFQTLRVLADRPGTPARFLVLGSASPELLRQTSESLAGRIAFHDLSPLGLSEVGIENTERLWSRGGFPRSFLASDEPESADWRRHFTRTFLERDLPDLGVILPAETLARFWAMLAHVHGQVFNASEIGRAFGVGHTTVRRWLDVLVHTYVMRVLPPWHENLAKRQVKSPKVYVADTGILHSLLGIETLEGLARHPKAGASWESFCMEAVVARLGARWDQCWFWATHASAEIDLVVMTGSHRLGFEFKRTSGPGVTPSMRIALEDLRLDHIDVVHSGNRTFPMADRIRAVALERVLSDIEPLSAR